MATENSGETKRVVTIAKQEAVRCRSAVVGPEHVLLAILQEDKCVAAELLRELNVHFERVRQEVEWKLTPAAIGAPNDLPLAPETKAALEHAASVARKFGQTEIGTEHLLLGLLEKGGVAGAVLSKMGVTPKDVMELLDAGDR